MPIRKQMKHVTGLSLSNYPEFDNHEFVIGLSDKASGLRGYIAVHDSTLGITHGGSRMKAYENEEDALRDALNLSRAMSYKSALAGLPYGGAKGVIILNESAKSNRKKVLKAYAQRIDALNGLFHTGTDVGLTDEDTTYMADYCRYILGVKQIGMSELTTAKAAALGVFNAIKAAAKHRYGSASLKGKTVGVKGVGKLGYELVRLLVADGALVTAADVDDAAIMKLKNEFPSVQTAEADGIHKLPFNIYAPCALGAEFNQATIKQLQCEIIAGGANNQLVSLEDGDRIFERGILYVPDYIANAGGLIFVSDELEPGGFKESRIIERLDAIKATLEKVFERSTQENLPTHRMSDKIAKERIEGIAAV